MDPTTHTHGPLCQWELPTMYECGLPATVVYVETGVDPYDGEHYVVELNLCKRHAWHARLTAKRWPSAVRATYTQRPMASIGGNSET